MDGAVVQEATFRGRQLCGVAHDLPDGYQGARACVTAAPTCELTKAFGPTPSSLSLLLGVVLARDPKGEAWRASSAFARFTAWNHDTQPTSADAAPRLLHWLRLAAALAAPVDADAVTRRLAEGEVAGAPAEAPPLASDD